MTESYDDVSKIHKRYSLTLLTPSSKYHSLIFSAIISAITGYFILTSYFDRADELAYKLPILIGVLLITQKIDARLIRNREYSKALHMSLFGNMSSDRAQVTMSAVNRQRFLLQSTSLLIWLWSVG